MDARERFHAQLNRFVKGLQGFVELAFLLELPALFVTLSCLRGKTCTLLSPGSVVA